MVPLVFLSRRDPFQAHNERVRHMMRSFSEPFGGHFGHFMPSLTDGRDWGRGPAPGQPSSSVALQNEHRVRTEKSPSPVTVSLMFRSAHETEMLVYVLKSVVFK